MAQLIVRNLEDDVKAKLQQRARQHGRSTEEEVREILRAAVRTEPRKMELLAPGRRRDRLFAAFDRAIDEILDGRVLPFDRTAAVTAAAIAVRQRQVGRSVEIRDVQIAGIAAARKATLATRNTRHFADLGITLVDPWQG